MKLRRALFGLVLLSACDGAPDAANPGDGGDEPDAALDAGPSIDAGFAMDASPDAGVEVATSSIVLINLEPGRRTSPRDLSPDGRLALFEVLGQGDLYFYDTMTGVAERKTSLTFVDRNQALGVSATGKIAAENGYPVQASVWSDANGWRELGSPFATGCIDTTTSSLTDVAGAWDISADGTAVVGLAYDGCVPKAFLWTDDGTTSGVFTPLQVLGVPFMQPEPNNRATVISHDGRVIAGWAQNGPVDRSPAIWNADGSGFMIDPTDMDAPGEILSISPDGSVFAGVWGNEGFVWSEAGGRVEMGRFPESLPFDGVFPNAMAANGELLFGTNGGIAFVWSAAFGMRRLDAVVRAGGLELAEGIYLNNVLGASEDGSVIIGSATDTISGPFETQLAFTIRLPASAYR